MKLSIQKTRVSYYSKRINAIKYIIDDSFVIEEPKKVAKHYIINQIYKTKEYEIEYTIKVTAERLSGFQKLSDNILVKYSYKNNVFTVKISITDKYHGKYLSGGAIISSYIIDTYKLKSKELETNISFKIQREYFMKTLQIIAKKRKDFNSKYQEEQPKLNTRLDNSLYNSDKTAILLEAGSEIYIGSWKLHDCIGNKYRPSRINRHLLDIQNEKRTYQFEICAVCGRIFLDVDDEMCKKMIRVHPNYEFKIQRIEDARNNKCIQDGEKMEAQIKEINIGEFLTRTTIYHCISEEHKIVDIKAKIKVIKHNGMINEMQIPAGLCINCNKYYILESEYNKIKKQGIILCKLVEMNYWKQTNLNYIYSMNEESMLHLLGYNVSAQCNLSRVVRRRLLETIIDEKLLSKIEICNHLDYLIRRSKNQSQLMLAVDKWQEDREYIAGYENEELKTHDVQIIKRRVINSVD